LSEGESVEFGEVGSFGGEADRGVKSFASARRIAGDEVEGREKEKRSTHVEMVEALAPCF